MTPICFHPQEKNLLSSPHTCTVDIRSSASTKLSTYLSKTIREEIAVPCVSTVENFLKLSPWFLSSSEQHGYET
ncbi:hypothetical protein SDJN03_25053, partial [Cucurbita argyrosperma subsp. sororia]